MAQLPQVSDEVWHLLEQMRISMGRIAPGSAPNHTMMKRPRYDETSIHVLPRTQDTPMPQVSPMTPPNPVATPVAPMTPPVYDAAEYEALNGLINPGPVKRLGRLLPGQAERDRGEEAILRQTLIGSLREVAQFAGSDHNKTVYKDLEPDPAGEPTEFSQAVAGAWTAAHFDTVLGDLEAHSELPVGTTERLALRWDEANWAKQQEILAAVDPLAPAGYAFAHKVAKKLDLDTEQVLQGLVSARPNLCLHAAAEQVMAGSQPLAELAGKSPRGYYELRNEVASSIKSSFTEYRDAGSAPAYVGEKVAERAIDRMRELETAAGSPPGQKAAQGVPYDSRTGMADAHGATDRTKGSDAAGAFADGKTSAVPQIDGRT